PITTDIYTLSLHDALPIFIDGACQDHLLEAVNRIKSWYLLDRDSFFRLWTHRGHVLLVGHTSLSFLPCWPVLIDIDFCSIALQLDRKSTRLNSSHVAISYA